MRSPADLVVGLVFEQLARVADISLFATGISLFYCNISLFGGMGISIVSHRSRMKFLTTRIEKSAKNYRNSLFFPAKQRITAETVSPQTASTASH